MKFSSLVLLGSSLLLIATSWTQTHACEPVGLNVQQVGLGPSAHDGNEFGEAEVESHFQSQLDRKSYVYYRHDRRSLSCVDARGDEPIHGTPGGDLAEFALAVAVYFRDYQGITEVSKDLIRPLLVNFLAMRIHRRRPLYFHTDSTKLNIALTRISSRLGRRVTILPGTTPPVSELDVWFEELSKADVQGCGHIRLMIDNPSAYGLSSNSVIKNLIELYYERFWECDEGKRNFNFVVKLGSLEGKAVGIVSSPSATTSSSTCSGHSSPALYPNYLGSSVFVYHPTAADWYRTSVLATYFKSRDPNVNVSTFKAAIDSLFNIQLNATLTLLSPANKVDLFSVELQTVNY